MKRQCQSEDSNRHFSMDVISTVQHFFFLIKHHRRPSINRRPIQGVHGRGMGVHAHTAPVWRQCRAPKVDTSPSIRRRFIDVTPMESSKVAYYTPMPRLWFLTGMCSDPWAPRITRCKRSLQIARLVATTGARTRVHGYARPSHCLCGHLLLWYIFIMRVTSEEVIIIYMRYLIVYICCIICVFINLYIEYFL